MAMWFRFKAILYMQKSETVEAKVSTLISNQLIQPVSDIGIAFSMDML